MATFYFRPATGNWSAAGTWSNSSGGASNGLVPDATTDCVLDAGSGAFALTIDGTSGSPNLCRSLVCTGFANTLTAGATAYLKIGDGTAGALTLVSGMTFVPNAAATFEFVSTTTGNNITSGGKALPNPIFNGVGGAWTFQDATTAGNGTITITNGSLTTNNQTVLGHLSSSNSNVRSLTLGTTTWTLPSSAGSWNISTSTNMTLSASSATVVLNSTGNCTFNGGGLTYGTL